ncbi:PCD23 protein, partial [Piprites chloris]|nr:PCD23 protein [Piprites chloris]
LDRERAEVHRLVVEAWDGGSPRRRGRLRVSVRVLDENDNAPTFSRGEYRARLREDAPPGTAVCRLRATDPDLGANGEVRYAINRRQSDPDGYFAVEERSGVLRLRRPLDRETRALHRLVVEARDGGAEPEGGLSAQAFVRIEIEDINDNQPVFEQDMYVTSISSHTQPGTEVINVVATDRDSGIYGIVTEVVSYRISSGDPHGKFSIDPQFGIIRTKKQLDHETQAVFADKQQEYTLHISAEDCGSPPLTSLLVLDSLAVKIIILDVNDNNPNFTSSPLSYVMEDVEVGFLVHHIIAKDPDEGRNGQVTYHILSGNENKAFVLDKITGLLTTAQLLDREIQERYSLTVMALDDGSPALSAMQVLTIIVLDVNDEIPIFTKQLYETAVHENQDPGEFVVKVEAVDRDAGLNSLLWYKILPGIGYEKFKMNSSSGELVTTASLDRESQEVFSIKGSPSRSSTAQLYLTVLDENDHSPLFAKTQYQISVTEDLEEGSAILDLCASDEDDGLNGEVMYSLIDNTFGAFAINSVTGSIVTTKALDQETKSQYTFRVVASDCSTHLPRSTTVSVVVHIEDVNDNDPIFLQNPIRAFVPAETPVNETVATVRAEDVDLGSNGAIVFNLMIAETVFQIDVKTGDIILREPLASKDFSTQLLVTASDQGVPPRTATAMVIIFTEEHEEEISFSHSLYEASVPENSAAGGH